MTTSAADEVIAGLQVLTEEQVAAITGLGRNTLKAMRRKGIGPRVTVLSTGRIGYRARDVQAWLDERAEVREVDVESFELPSAQERAEVGLEALAAVEAIRHRDFDTLNEILFGSQHPAKRHCIESMVMCAFLISRDENPDALVAELQARIADPPTD